MPYSSPELGIRQSLWPAKLLALSCSTHLKIVRPAYGDRVWPAVTKVGGRLASESMIPVPVADRAQPATELVCGDGSEKSLAVVHVDAHLGVGPGCIPRPATDQLTVGDVLRSFEPIHCFDSHLADDRAWQVAQLDVGSRNLHPH